MKDTSDRIIFVLLAIIILFGVLAFFKVPAYEKGTWAFVILLSNALTGVMSFKFGVHKQQVGNDPPDNGSTDTSVTVDTHTESPAPKADSPTPEWPPKSKV